MKKLLLLPLLFLINNSYADELHHFDQIKSAVTSGKSIRIGIDFPQCEASKNNIIKAQYNFGIFTPNEMSVGEGRIIGSVMHFTLNDPRVPEKAVYEYIRVRIMSDNHVHVSFHILDAVNYFPVADKMLLECIIGKGAKIYS
jgi:hypothetical protein